METVKKYSVTPNTYPQVSLFGLGNVAEITTRFGGVEPFREAVTQLQKLLYAAQLT